MPMEINVKGTIVLIDDADAAMLLGMTMSIRKDGYVTVRGSRRKRGGDNFLHRVLLNPEQGKSCDHINGVTTDNRRENLRICSHAENMRNRKPRKTQSGYKGVKWHKGSRVWRAFIRYEGKSYHPGQSKDPAQAAKKYDRKARELHGEFARTNFACLCEAAGECEVCTIPAP